MEDSILEEISKVFGISIEDSKEFLHSMDATTGVPEEYFQSFVTKLPRPSFTNSDLSTLNTTLFINTREETKGAHGSIKYNTRNPFVYKFQRIAKDAPLKQFLTEPLINCILQQITLAKPYVCRIYKVFWLPQDTDNLLILKLEDLKGGSLYDYIPFQLGENKEENLELVLRILGPLLETLEELREKYSFEHQDLHGQNLMFVEKPNLKDKRHLHIKMIDFGMSALTFGGRTFGTVVLPYKEAQIFKIITELDYFPAEIKENVNNFHENRQKLTEYFLQLYIAMKHSIQKNLHKTREGALRNSTKKKFLGGKRKYRKTRKE